MRHVLVSSRRPLADELRPLADASTVFFSVVGEDATLERLARSYRVDAIVTDDVEVERSIREEIPGNLPLYLAGEDEEASSVWEGLKRLLEDGG